uniref:Aminotransferase-like plant mobile domain-containing protein n=1 Tax=Solanum lycopersicum TaxID=4081 RepID=A0A3Q7IIZ8_SOLLC
MESVVQCLRAYELVCLDCQELYRPNRVAMQFGYDQVLPKWIPQSPSSLELSRPIDFNLRLYYPSRLFEPDIELAAKRPLVAAIKIVTSTNSKNSAIPPVKSNSILYPVVITTTTF